MTNWDTARSGASSIAFIGDSITRGENILGPLRTSLQSEYGDGGDGWLSITGAAPSTSTVTTAGTWSTVDATSAAVGVDVQHMNSTDTATPASAEFESTATDFVIHYLKQANGGSFRYQVDGGGWTTVDTSNASSAFASVSITGLSNAAHTVRVEVTVAGTAGVTLMGVDAQISGGGVRVHDLGNSGSAASQWVTVNEAIWKDGIAALDPDLVILWLGANDRTNNASPYTTMNHKSTLISRLRNAVPSADILVLSIISNGNAATHTTTDFVAGAYGLARARNLAFFDTWRYLGEFAEADAAGYFLDNAHPSALGGAQIATPLGAFLMQ